MRLIRPSELATLFDTPLPNIYRWIREGVMPYPEHPIKNTCGYTPEEVLSLRKLLAGRIRGGTVLIKTIIGRGDSPIKRCVSAMEQARGVFDEVDENTQIVRFAFDGKQLEVWLRA